MWLYAAGSIESSPAPDSMALILLLVCVAVDIADVRFFRSLVSTIVKSAVLVAVAPLRSALSVLVVSVAFDLAKRAPVAAVAIPVAVGAALAPREVAASVVFASIIAAFAGWIARRHEESSSRLIAATDAERRIRYRLENAQRRLDTASTELVRVTERAERTRIAHAIHDEVGHRLTGVLMQLEAVRRLGSSAPARASAMLDTAITALSEAVESVRETVHDLRPRPESDAKTLRRLVAEFRFCPVDLSVDEGTFGSLPDRHREVCVAAVRELLTNAARHSRARSISITIKAGSRVRLIYRDDGVGAVRIREGLGLSGIRRRVEALGGTFAASGHDGFSVRCVVPVEEANG